MLRLPRALIVWVNYDDFAEFLLMKCVIEWENVCFSMKISLVLDALNDDQTKFWYSNISKKGPLFFNCSPIYRQIFKSSKF